MRHLIEGGDRALDRARAIAADHDDGDCVPLRGEGQLLAPLPRPIQMRDCLCFEDHLTNGIDGRNKTLGIAERTPDQSSEEHTSELQVTNAHLVCRLLLVKKKTTTKTQ